MAIDIGVRHMRVVVAVADEGGYTAAAEHLHVAQSSLSRTVQEVEQRLGVRLFERTTRRVRTSRDGEEFLTVARRVLTEYDAALNHLEGYLEGSRGVVSIATLPSLAATMLPSVLAAYRDTRPEVTVRVSDGLSREVLSLLAGGAVDLAVTVAAGIPDDLIVRHVAVDRFVCLAPSGHRFLEREEVSWADLAGEPFVAFDDRSSIRTYVERTLREQAVRLGTVTEAANVGAVAGLTSAGLGVTVVPGFVLPMMSFADVHARRLVRPTIEREICLVRDGRRPMSRAAVALEELLIGAGERALELPQGARWV